MLEHPARGGPAYLVNEAHGLRTDVFRQLLVLLERVLAHVVIIFATTMEGLALLEMAHIMSDLSPSS